MTLPNIGEVTANLLYSEGFHTLEDIAFSDTDMLVKMASFKSDEEARRIQTAARIALKDKLDKLSIPEHPSNEPEES
jgi:hypothetical protein